MKVKWSKKYVSAGITGFLVVAASILFLLFLLKFDVVSRWIGAIISMLMPIILGLAFAYLLNPVQNFFENTCYRRLFKKLLAKKPKSKLPRVLSVATAITAALLVIGGLIGIMLPQLIGSVKGLIDKMPGYLANFKEWLDRMIVENHWLASIVGENSDELIARIQKSLESALPALQEMAGNVTGVVIGGAIGVVNAVTDFILGLVVSIYVMYSKERFAAQAKKVIAVEVDKSLLPILAETLAGCDNVRIINEDILKLDIDKIIAEETAGGGEAKVIGNLPYYITTPIIMKLLEETTVKSITIMMQKEVADRIKAAPGSKIYGAISVAVQYYCQVEKIADVPKTVFIPQPQVDSVVLRLVRKEDPGVEVLDKGIFFACVKAGFGQRRKTLLNSLQTVRGTSKAMIEECLAAAGVEAGRRAETLSLEEFGKISNEVYKRL